jgi:O-antigen/teichoic acid export membrane protein
MQNSVQKRALNNYSIGIISFIISFLQAIITVPILLNYWGNDVYGIWVALFAGFSLLQSLDFGHQSFIGNLLNIEYYVNKEKFSLYLGSSLLMAMLLGIIQLSVTIFLIATGYLTNFLGISIFETDYSIISISMISLMIMWVIAGSVGGILVKILIPAGYMMQSLIWGIIFKLAQFLTLVFVAISGGMILEASIAYSVVQMFLSLLVFRYIKNKLPEFYPWWKFRDLKVGIQNLKKSTVLTLNNTLQQLSNSGLILFITNFFSTAMVPAFTTIRTLTNTATVFTNLFITSIQPDLIKYHAKQETEKIKSTLNANWFFSGFVVNIALILLIPFAEIIFRLWTKDLVNFDFKLFISLAASISIINFGAGLYNYLFGINHLYSISIITFSRTITLFVFSFILAEKYGLPGIGLSVLISEIMASMFLPFILVNKILKQLNSKLSFKNFLVASLAPIIILSIAVYSIMTELSLIIYLIDLSLIVLVYIFNWTILEDEIKTRFRDLLTSLFSRLK